MKYYFLVILLVFIFLNANCQVHFDPLEGQVSIHSSSVHGANWNPGYIILNTGEKLIGGVHFDPVIDAVYVKEADEVQIFSPKNVLEFKFEEDKFVSLPYDERSDGFVKDFFFLVLEENKHFLILQKISSTKVKKVKLPYAPSTSLAYLKNMKSIYLGLNDEGKIVKLGEDGRENKRILSDLYQEDFSWINNYMKKNGWDYRNLNEMIDALKHFYASDRD